MSPDAGRRVDVGGRTLTLSSLDRVVYPVTGTTKAEVIDYYARVAPALLGQLRDRPVTRIRFPAGVEGEKFFEKNIPRGAPDWLRRQTLHASPWSESDTVVTYPFVDDLAGLVWAANQNAVELHTPQWSVGPRGGLRPPDRLVVDLDPGEPAGLAECAQVAHLVAERLTEDGLTTTVPVTSGSKGMQLYASLPGRRSAEEVRGYAKQVAEELARAHPDLVVAVMRKALRPGKVLIDWSQNTAAKTTVTPYSLRGRECPAVAAPRHWDEVGPDLVQLSPEEVLRRLDEDGDLMAR